MWKKKTPKNKGCFQWSLSKLLEVLKGRDSVHRGSSVRVLAVFWLFSIDTTTVRYCLLELFPCTLKKGTLFLGLLSCHSKPTERVIDFSGIGIKSLYTLEIQVYGSRTKRNCPEFGSSPLLQAGLLSLEEFFPIWSQLPPRMLKEAEIWIWPKNSPVPHRLACWWICLCYLGMHWSNCELTAHCPVGREQSPGDTGSGQCPSALSPAQWGELDCPPGKERIQHVPPPVPLSHGPFIGDASTEEDDAVSSP